MFGINYKMWINEAVTRKYQEYLEWLNTDDFWKPVSFGYANAEDERFMEYYKKEICNHPKSLYRPANTVLMHYLELKDEVIEKQLNGDFSAEEWEKICLHTRQISRAVTDAVVTVIQSYGREISLLSELEEWKHIYGAEIAGMGTFEVKNGMVCSGNRIGSMGALATELILEH